MLCYFRIKIFNELATFFDKIMLSIQFDFLVTTSILLYNLLQMAKEKKMRQIQEMYEAEKGKQGFTLNLRQIQF